MSLCVSGLIAICNMTYYNSMALRGVKKLSEPKKDKPFSVSSARGNSSMGFGEDGVQPRLDSKTRLGSQARSIWCARTGTSLHHYKNKYNLN